MLVSRADTLILDVHMLGEGVARKVVKLGLEPPVVGKRYDGRN